MQNNSMLIPTNAIFLSGFFANMNNNNNNNEKNKKKNQRSKLY